jgi:hypothetical protein
MDKYTVIKNATYCKISVWIFVDCLTLKVKGEYSSEISTSTC